ncbi:hypothetical protein MP638_003663 [Amoeboaphelidium occidentale]|nr:hypothetical protein MP638_003663 [Amoeboaphelidium occidentale]
MSKDSYSEMLDELFSSLKKDRQHESPSVNNTSTQQTQMANEAQDDPISGWVKELVKQSKTAIRKDDDEEGDDAIHQVAVHHRANKQDVNLSIMNRLTGSESSYELKRAIAKFVEVFFPEDPSASPAEEPKPLLLAMTIASCRKFHSPGMALALVNFIQEKSELDLVQWVDVNVANELILLNWVNKDIEACLKRLQLMDEFAIVPNSRTVQILSDIESHIGSVHVSKHTKYNFMQKLSEIKMFLSGRT